MTEVTIRCHEAARWYGEVIAVGGISFELGPGVTGLLGPNGAGKTTLLRLLMGLISPTTGTVEVLGEPSWGSVEVRRRVGYCPEHDDFYEDMTGHDFVTLMTRLSGVPAREARKRAEAVLEKVRLPLAEGGATKPIKSYSKGMRQKVKLAQALAHNPDVVILDEPLTGTDPVSRSQISDLVAELGREGRTVVISSHVLHEVERVTQEFILMSKGRLLAKGNVSEIRSLIDNHPHRIQIQCDQPRALAAGLIGHAELTGITFDGTDTLEVLTPRPDACYDAIVRVSLDGGIELQKMVSPDNNLEAVFRYLTGA